MATEQTYDFVIVGGGTAGLVLANRLTENPATQVLVIEAGANRNADPKITVPGLCTTLYDDPTYDWVVSTVPQVSLSPSRLLHQLTLPRNISMERVFAMGGGRFWAALVP